jgi:hypothetical protein
MLPRLLFYTPLHAVAVNPDIHLPIAGGML